MLRRVILVSPSRVLSKRLLCSRSNSILNDTIVRSPFEDPSRTRIATSLNVISTTPTVLKNNLEINHEAKAFYSMEPPDKSKKEEPNLEKKAAIVEEVSSTSAPKSEAEPTPAPKAASAAENATACSDSSSSGNQSDGNQHHNDEEAQKKRERLAKNTKIGMMVVLGSAVAGFVSFCFYYGRAPRDEAGNLLPDEFGNAGIFAPFYRIANSIKFWRDPAREKLLPDPIQPPYHQPKYTLVIEMKNVLVAPEWTYKTGYRFIKRPALEYFLEIVGYPNFEVVIYTSESNFTGPPVVEAIDPKGRIMWKLYRDCTKYKNGIHIKLNRDLSKVIFIEHDPQAFQLNPENVLRVPKWDGDMTDTSLVDLAELLKTIHLSDVEDVRPTLQYYSSFDNPAAEFRKRALFLAQQEEDKKRAAESKDDGILSRYSGRFFGFRRHQYAK